MNKTQIFVLIIAVTACLVFMAGCTSTTTNPPAPQSGVQATPRPVLDGDRYPSITVTSVPVQYAEVNGVRLGYREFGSGEPLLMINGFGSNMNIAWNGTFLGILASKYHVYTFDNRGMGYSSDSNLTPTMSTYSDDAAGLMQALGYSSMNVYGASMGSSIAQQLVIDHPERVRKLILESVTYSIRIPETKELRALIESVAINASEPQGIRHEAHANLVWNGSWAELPGISKSVMLAVGTDDVLTPQAVAVQIAGQINGSWLLRYKDLPHIGSRYAPVEYGKNTLEFLGTNQTPPYAT
jgi:pimeloyl-ACP methyl ester carboxylesterase